MRATTLPAGVDAARGDLNAARAEFGRVFRSIPDAALAYRPPQDDFAIGGIIVHVAEVLTQYASLLDGFQASGNGHVFQAEPTPDAQRTEWVHSGFAPEQREMILRLLDEAHTAFCAALASLPAGRFSSKVPVMFRSATEPSPSSAEDVAGWMRGHYFEHAAQLEALLADWRGSRP